MKALRYTLVSDGPTDANLIPIINWTLKSNAGIQLPEGRRAEFWRLKKPPTNTADRLLKAVELFPCQVLFVHRDAEKDEPQARFNEILRALDQANLPMPLVAIVPVRMLEAWLCFSEDAIRKASGNPNGKLPLRLPTSKRIETCPDPKENLANALLLASELSGRRRKKFNTAAAFSRIVDCIEDYSPLRELSSFRTFENSVRSLIKNEWRPGLYFE